MEWLRWILLAVGIVLIGAVYFSGRGLLRWRNRSQQSAPDVADDLGDEWVGKPRVRRSAEDSASAGDEADDAAVASRTEAEVRSADEDEVPPDFLTQSDFDFTISREPIGTPPADEDVGGTTESGVPDGTPDNAQLPPDPEPEPAAEPPPGPESAPEPEPEPCPEPEPVREPRPEPPPGPSPEAESGRGSSPSRETPAEHDAPDRPAAPEHEDEPEHMIVLYLAAPEGERLVGAQLAVAFARHGLEHGELGIFHARAGGDGSAERPERTTDFSIANAVEPGSFDPATMDTLSTPGVVLFMRVPGPKSPINAFDRMVAVARSLGEELGARVLDDKKIPLTRQEEQHLRDQLRQAIPSMQRARPSDRGRR